MAFGLPVCVPENDYVIKDGKIVYKVTPRPEGGQCMIGFAAEWSCMTELSGVSCSNGGMPVMIPDFTRGDWNKVQGLQLAL